MKPAKPAVILRRTPFKTANKGAKADRTITPLVSRKSFPNGIGAEHQSSQAKTALQKFGVKKEHWGTFIGFIGNKVFLKLPLESYVIAFKAITDCLETHPGFSGLTIRKVANIVNDKLMEQGKPPFSFPHVHKMLVDLNRISPQIPPRTTGKLGGRQKPPQKTNQPQPKKVPDYLADLFLPPEETSAKNHGQRKPPREVKIFVAGNPKANQVVGRIIGLNAKGVNSKEIAKQVYGNDIPENVSTVLTIIKRFSGRGT